MTTEKIELILRSVSERVEELIPSERFYVVLYDPGRGELSFPLVRKTDDILSSPPPWLSRSINLDSILPDWVISHGKSLLVEKEFSSHLQQNQMGYWPDHQIPQSWLGVPMTIGGQIAGALVIENWREFDFFDANHLRILSTVARQTATAIETARLYEQREQKIINLQILNRMGQQLTKGLAKQEQEILELIYKSVTDLKVDTNNIYIAFYDPDSRKIDTKDEIHGYLRFPLAFDEGRQISIPSRAAGHGLTEYVIRTKETYAPLNVAAAYQSLADDQNEKIPFSWLGVPMLSDGQVFGIIVLRSNDFERIYTRDDQEMLEILAGQAAVSLQNLRLFEANQKEQAQRISFEKIFAMGTMAAEFAHKMNNIAGTIPVRVTMAKAELDAGDPKDQRVLKQLDKIEIEAGNLLQAAQEIRESIELGETRTAENIQVNDLLDIAIVRAINTRLNIQNEVETVKNFKDGLPQIEVDRSGLLDTLTNIIKNGFEAIHENGVVTITTRLGTFEERASIEIEIKDTGTGIPRSDLPKIFDLFYTTKGDKGLGFGLWRDKVFIKKFGGEIDVYSEENHGSSFIVRIPIIHNVQTPNEK